MKENLFYYLKCVCIYIAFVHVKIIDMLITDNCLFIKLSLQGIV